MGLQISFCVLTGDQPLNSETRILVVKSLDFGKILLGFWLSPDGSRRNSIFVFVTLRCMLGLS